MNLSYPYRLPTPPTLFYGPGFENFDFSLLKDIKLAESKSERFVTLSTGFTKLRGKRFIPLPLTRWPPACPRFWYAVQILSTISYHCGAGGSADALGGTAGG